jgi:biofilm PGA synthesis N-glycosyltransferase PgaC
MLWLLIIPFLPYLLVLLFIWRHLLSFNSIRTSPDQNVNVNVTVIVACKNEEKNLPALLHDLSKQNYPAEKFEVIIVDDNSSDNTASIVSAFMEIKNLKILMNEGTGKKSAIRTGVLASESELIMTTDADCRMGKDWISSVASFYGVRKPEMIIGQVILESKSGFFQGFQELEFLSLQGVTAGSAAAGEPVMCNGANLAFKKEIYLNHSGNLHREIASGDDVFLMLSLKKDKGSKILGLNSEDAIVTTASEKTIASFLKQRARWISKVGAYRDGFTQLVGIVTFVTILDLLFLLVAGFFNPQFFIIYGAALILKSIPDLLILFRTARMHKKISLLKWFLPSQIVYPFYVVAVIMFSAVGIKKWR